jgi:hypothetical protein
MSYSRWISSNWYSFWNNSTVSDIKDNQVLSLWYDLATTLDFPYKELVSFDPNKLKTLYPNASDEDINEALDIIKQFMHDIDNAFSTDDLK